MTNVSRIVRHCLQPRVIRLDLRLACTGCRGIHSGWQSSPIRWLTDPIVAAKLLGGPGPGRR